MGTIFGTLETAKRGMYTQQSAIATTSHNISNAGNENYTRQRVNMTTTPAYPAVGFNQPNMGGQIGTGVKVDSVQRIREEFLDVQYRSENNKYGYYEAVSTALSQMEDILNEPSDVGLAKVVDQFWQALQDLGVNPENEGAKQVVAERANAIADTFNYITDSLTAIQSDLKNQAVNAVDTMQSYINQIQELNKQIAAVEPHGLVPNDLYDKRTKLLDELSNIVNINVTYEASGGIASAVAEGKVTVRLTDASGKAIEPALVNGLNVNEKPLELLLIGTKGIDGLKIGEKLIESETLSKGKLKGLIEAHGYTKTGANEVSGEYPEMLGDIITLAKTFEEKLKFDDTSIFTVSDTGAVRVNDTLLTDYLAGLTSAETKAWAQATYNNVNNATNTSVNFSQTYQDIIGAMGVRTQETSRLEGNSKILLLSVENNRTSVTGVSIDEELTNLITYQHAYNASARMITVVDEMLDKIINGMGLVGR